MARKTMSCRVPLFVFVCFFTLMGFLFNPSRGHGFTTAQGGETITWNFNGIPASNIFTPTNPCYYKADTNYYVCSYNIQDPPYGNKINFVASVTPTQGSLPAFLFGYFDMADIASDSNFKWLDSTTCVFPCPSPMTLSTSFYIPAKAGEFTLSYSSSGSGTGVTNIEMQFKIANYDPCRASLFGGDDINPDGDYCDEQTGPGAPEIRKYHNKKGAGPGT